MASTTLAAKEYWGSLIEADKSPSPLLEQLLLGIANYINKHITPWDVQCLSPTKLATFYRLVGGNYDILFLETPCSSLSLIYQTLGCFHTLQPDKSPFAPPSIPSLTPQGFVRWQTVQLLLGPEEHVPFLQEALKRFEIINPTEMEPFPKFLPKEALPTIADVEMTEWHEDVSEKLRLHIEASSAQKSTSAIALDAHKDTLNSRQSPIDERQPVDTSDYSSARRSRTTFAPRSASHVSPAHHQRHHLHVPASPAYPEHRRRSLPDHRVHRDAYPSSDRSTPRGPAMPRPNHRPRARPRTPSTLSTSSGSETDDRRIHTPNETSLSPPLRHRPDLHIQHVRPGCERRHSAHVPYSPIDHAPHQQIHRSPSHAPSHLPEQRPNSQVESRSNRGGPRDPNARWRDVDYVREGPSSTVSTPSAYPGVRFVEGRKGVRDDRVRSRTTTSPVRGVSGRKYVPDGVVWK